MRRRNDEDKGREKRAKKKATFFQICEQFANED